MTPEQELKQFALDSHNYFIKNKWLQKDESLYIYVRRSRRILNNNIYIMLDIANVEANPKGKGRFSKFIDYVLDSKLEPFQGVFVENVMVKRFQNFFKKLNFTEYYSNMEKEGFPSFYLIY